MEAARGNGYAPVRGLPVMMLTDDIGEGYD